MADSKGANGNNGDWDPSRYGDAIILGGRSLPMDTWALPDEELLSAEDERQFIQRLGNVIVDLAASERDQMRKTNAATEGHEK